MKRHYGIPNPEAPLDGLHEHWEPPPQSHWWWVILIALTVAILVGIVLAFTVGEGALAHVKERPDLDAWMNGLTSKGGYPCCSHIDGSTLPDAEWDTLVANGEIHYRVRIDGQWIVVTDEEVVEGPNKFGQAIAWIYRNADGTPSIRCFLAGAGG